jgi:hypothetical protein
MVATGSFVTAVIARPTRSPHPRKGHFLIVTAMKNKNGAQNEFSYLPLAKYHN